MTQKLKLPLKIEEGGAVVEADGRLVFNAVDVAELAEVELLDWIVEKINEPTVDDVLRADQHAMILALDVHQPGWWVSWTDEQDRRSWMSAVHDAHRWDKGGGSNFKADFDRLVQGQKRRALGRLRDATSLIGRAFLQVRAKGFAKEGA